MQNSNSRWFHRLAWVAVLCTLVPSIACEQNIFQSNSNSAALSMRDVPAVRLNYQYEPDVPAPTLSAAQSDDVKNNAVQADFDASRPQEILDRTITSPDKKHVLAAYRNVSDQPSEVRLDMYAPDGKLLRKVTADSMAVHFPDTIVWSPDSRTVAFVAMSRAQSGVPLATPPPVVAPPDAVNDSNANVPDSNAAPTPTPAAPTPAAPTGILAYKTEQIYLCDAEGTGLKALTQNEGLIYFYYVWSPDSTMLAALASTLREWKYQEIVADSKGEALVPQGRLRIVEKNGRERRLDDNVTSVRPVWSPDSAKVAISYDTQVRIYDAVGTNPTQAAVPLKNQLLISSQAYDRDQQRKLQASNANADPNTAASPTPNEPTTTLPDEKLLVSYNPIVEMAWTADDLLYLKTAYIRRMKNEADNVTSFARWHRLVLTAQTVATPAH